jgi:hypothetical protein
VHRAEEYLENWKMIDEDGVITLAMKIAFLSGKCDVPHPILFRLLATVAQELNG